MASDPSEVKALHDQLLNAVKDIRLRSALKTFLESRIEAKPRISRTSHRNNSDWSYTDSRVYDDHHFLKERIEDVSDLDTRHLVIPSGSYDDDVICLMNYPTFKTKTPLYGEMADPTNPSIRWLQKFHDGFAGVFYLDAVPYRMSTILRNAKNPQPWKMLPDSVLDVFSDNWITQWKKSRARVGFVHGAPNY